MKPSTPNNHQTLAVIGAGTMGEGIAHLAATHTWQVQLIDVNENQLNRAMDGIRRHVLRQLEKKSITQRQHDNVLDCVHPHTDIKHIGGCNLIIEAIVEDLTVKQKLFAELERVAPPSAVFATNTSSLSVTRIAEPLKNPDRLVGMHFFNPPIVMPLVEIIAGKYSSPAVIQSAADIAVAWGKTTVIAKDTPGFIVNRVARGYYLEALRLLGEGVAGIDEIDAIMRNHGGFRMGPFQLMDLVGLDVNLAVTTSVWQRMGRPARLAPHAIQQDLVAKGHLGRKTNRGFYLYDESTPLAAHPVHRKSFQTSPLQTDALRAFCERAGATSANITEHLVFARVLGAVINEAAIALHEDVATESDIDIAMQKGTNYPQGPLAWARKIGLFTVRGALNAMNASTPDARYTPAPLFA